MVLKVESESQRLVHVVDTYETVIGMAKCSGNNRHRFKAEAVP